MDFGKINSNGSFLYRYELLRMKYHTKNVLLIYLFFFNILNMTPIN